MQTFGPPFLVWGFGIHFAPHLSTIIMGFIGIAEPSDQYQGIAGRRAKNKYRTGMVVDGTQKLLGTHPIIRVYSRRRAIRPSTLHQYIQ
jgi:hypothetical protein